MWSRVLDAPKLKNSITLLNADLRDDPKEDKFQEYDDLEIVVSRVEARAREQQKSIGTKKSARANISKRNYAKELHLQADLLHHSGDYESALVLYHRAATAYPRELSHSVAARRTSAAIISATNPSRSLRKELPRAKNASQLAAKFCPETAALRAKKIVEESTNPISSIKQILKDFDSRKDFWRDPSTFQVPRGNNLELRSNIMLKRWNRLLSENLEVLQAAFASRDFNRCLKIGDELLVISEALPNSYRYQIEARQYLAMTQIVLRRHDLAVDQVSWMVRLAKVSGNIDLRSKSIMTLGKVHLSFGHIDAVARAWERLVLDIDEAVPKAWLLHEIGRCYFEMKRHAKALETAGRCIEYADEGNSRKWLMHGKLLSGQALVELGRFGEAVGALEYAAIAASEEKDFETHEYVLNLIDRVTEALRTAVCSEKFVEFYPKPVEDRTRRSKSDDTLLCTKQKDWFDERIDKKFVARLAMEKSPQSGRIKNARYKSQRGRRNILKRGNSRLSIYPPRGSCTFDSGMTEEDINPLESATPSITSRYPHEADLSSRLIHVDPDETGDDELTSRTRVIRKVSKEDGNSTEKCLDEGKIDPDDKSSSGLDDEHSNRTGKTYVLDETRNFAIYQLGLTIVDKNLEVQVENQCSNRTEIIHKLDNSCNAECLLNERTNDYMILPVRGCLYDEGIDERDEDAENEKEKGEEEEEEEASTLKHHEVFSSCESKFSDASTAKTYVVDEKSMMSFRKMPDCYVDYEETMGCERRHYSSTAFSPSQLNSHRQSRI